ncbi:MAG: hypothetical protein RL701_5357 [Pseudomonadota bacterium]
MQPNLSAGASRTRTWHAPAEVLAAFIAFEEREQLFDRQLLGVAYWQLIRQDIFRETLQLLGLAANAHLRLEQLPLQQWLLPQLRQLPTTLRRSRFTHLPPAELLVATHPRYLQHRGQYICPYSQPLLWGTPHSRALLTGHYQGQYFAPDAGERTGYVDLGLAWAHAVFKLRELARSGFTGEQQRELAALATRWAEQLGAAASTAWSQAWQRRARTAVLTSVGLTPWFERLLDRMRPRLVVEVVGYRLVNQLLTLSARGRGIPVAELQHGTIGASHAAYNFAPGRKPAAFPDHLLTFGEIWRELTPGLPLPAAQVHAVGYGWLELQRAAYAPNRAAPGHARRILFISQRDIGAELAAVACELQARSQQRYELVYRLHPSEAPDWRERYPQLVSAGIRVELAQERPLYAAQAAADVQVGVYSTALIEGIAFGLSTCVIALPGHEQLAFLWERGLARRAENAEQLSQLLDTPAAISGTSSAALWAPNARQRFAQFVDHTLAPNRAAASQRSSVDSGGGNVA